MYWIILSIICLVSALWVWGFLLGYKVAKQEDLLVMKEMNAMANEAAEQYQDSQHRLNAVRAKYSLEMHEQN